MRPNIRSEKGQRDFGRVLVQHNRTGQQERHQRIERNEILTMPSNIQIDEVNPIES